MMKKIILSKTLNAFVLILLLSACGGKNYKDLKVYNDNGAKVIETIGKPDAIETIPDYDNMQLWHYYDLALDLEMFNDTLQAIIETNGMPSAIGKMGAAEEVVH